MARACEARLRELGAEPSFPPIVAASENGALPHAEPGDREIGSGELVVFDMGALLDGYCSDCTRTFATGDLGDDAREVYELVPQIVGRMSGKVGFEDAKLSVRQLARLEAAAGDDVDLLPAGDLVERLRMVKEPARLAPRPALRPA